MTDAMAGLVPAIGVFMVRRIGGIDLWPAQFPLSERAAGMNRVACCALALLSVLAAEAASAENLQPGRWRVLTTTLSGPLAPPQVATRCLTPEDVADPIKTFGPQASTVNSECERTEFRHEGAELKWRLQCRGQIDMDLTGQFIFDSPTRYSALITTKATMMERIVHDTMVSISAERIGECR